MWSYFGSKTNVINNYPAPGHQMIIEPFAGTARYSLKYFDRDILIVDRYKVITDIWIWLQKCSTNDILSLPDKMIMGQTVKSLQLPCREAELLYGFFCSRGLEKPRLQATKWVSYDRPNGFKTMLKRIASNLHKIRHWKIEHGDYSYITNNKATWFIDPPYQKYGNDYVFGSKKLNYTDLGNFCKSRRGQVIVCEGTGANWLPFSHLIEVKNTRARKNFNELIYSKDGQEGGVYCKQQPKLF